MKRLFLLIVTIITLTACAADSTGEARKKPRLPDKPKIAQASLQANLLGSSRIQEDEGENDDETDMEGLIERINQNIEQKNITVEDVERGWYYGSEDEKKWGTPSAWIWVNEDAKSHWISPNALEQVKDIEADKLCRATGGYYVISCVERELPHCENIAQSECRCSDSTKWVDDQGCILTGSEDKYTEINSEELKQGWYYGLNSQKKLNTPSNWIWSENGNNSRWQNPGAL